MRVKIRGKYYSLEFLPINDDRHGDCDSPTTKFKRIRISNKIRKSEKLLDIVVHEIIHASCWDLDEETVREMAIDIAKILHKLGARIQFPGKKEKS